MPAQAGRDGCHLAFSSCERTLATHTGADLVAVEAARRQLADELPLRPEQVVYAAQVHGAEVAVIEAPVVDPPGVDALVTSVPGLALAVLVADCVPVLLADPVAGVVGVAHAGRRGMDAGVARAAVAAMRDLGASAVRAVLGPSVCGRCYEVPAAMRDDVGARHPLAASVTWSATPSLDVAAGVLAQLADLGVPAQQLPGCTVEGADLGSVRRSGQGAARWAGLVWRASAPVRLAR